MASIDSDLDLAVPYSREAERAVLGVILLYSAYMDRVIGIVQPRDFYLECHRVVFKRMIAMAMEGIPIDLVALKDELQKHQEVEKAGGLAYIVGLTDGIPAAINIEHYARIVVEKGSLRGLIQLNEEAKARCCEGSETAEQIAADISARSCEIISRGGAGTARWKLWDAADAETWEVADLEWHVEPIIPKGGIGFMSAAPKDRKTLLTTDLSLHLAEAVSSGHDWLGRFPCMPTRVLYIAREDPARRIKERVLEIRSAYRLSLPAKEHLEFLIRERFNLMDPSHIAWVKRTVRQGEFDLLVLDVFNRMTPGLDENSAKEMAEAVSVLEELNRDLNVTILILDHTKKPTGKNTRRDSQDPNPFDLKGSVAKYGAADFMICLSRTKTPGRMQVFCENKDTDEHPHFFVDVSPKDSGQPKFSYAGDVAELAEDMKKRGEENRQRVLDAVGDDWISREEVQQKAGLGKSAVSSHLRALMGDKIESNGAKRNALYRRKVRGTDDDASDDER